jgi:hypothetical protein
MWRLETWVVASTVGFVPCLTCTNQQLVPSPSYRRQSQRPSDGINLASCLSIGQPYAPSGRHLVKCQVVFTSREEIALLHQRVSIPTSYSLRELAWQQHRRALATFATTHESRRRCIGRVRDSCIWFLHHHHKCTSNPPLQHICNCVTKPREPRRDAMAPSFSTAVLSI